MRIASRPWIIVSVVQFIGLGALTGVLVPSGGCAGTGDQTTSPSDGNAPRADFAIARDFAVADDFALPPAMDLAMAPIPQSCKELHALNPGLPDGTFTIDPDGKGPLPAIKAQCDMTTDGGGFTLVFNHDLAAAGYVIGFEQALLSNETDPTAGLYSILKYLGAFADKNGGYTLRIDWPGYARRNLWSQTSNPTDDVAVSGYHAIDVQANSEMWGGLELGNGTHGPGNGGASFLDGSVNHSYWYYAIGVRVLWGNPNGFPAGDEVSGPGMGVNRVRLWVK